MLEQAMIRKQQLTPGDVLPLAEYGKIRQETRRKLSARKRNRRIEVGPCVTFYFESYETMWMQVHEMLFIEKGGPEQIEDELSAYNPLIPKGQELVATFMIEIDDPGRRKRILSRLGGIEETAFIEFGGERIGRGPRPTLTAHRRRERHRRFSSCISILGRPKSPYSARRARRSRLASRTPLTGT